MNDGPTTRLASEGGGVHRNCWPRSSAYDLKARADAAESKHTHLLARLREAIEFCEKRANEIAPPQTPQQAHDRFMASENAHVRWQAEAEASAYQAAANHLRNLLPGSE